jgi:hypothetical protein
MREMVDDDLLFVRNFGQQWFGIGHSRGSKDSLAGQGRYNFGKGTNTVAFTSSILIVGEIAVVVPLLVQVEAHIYSLAGSQMDLEYRIPITCDLKQGPGKVPGADRIDSLFYPVFCGRQCRKHLCKQPVFTVKLLKQRPAFFKPVGGNVFYPHSGISTVVTFRLIYFVEVAIVPSQRLTLLHKKRFNRMVQVFA